MRPRLAIHYAKMMTRVAKPEPAQEALRAALAAAPHTKALWLTLIDVEVRVRPFVSIAFGERTQPPRLVVGVHSAVMCADVVGPGMRRRALRLLARVRALAWSLCIEPLSALRRLDRCRSRGAPRHKFSLITLSSHRAECLRGCAVGQCGRRRERRRS